MHACATHSLSVSSSSSEKLSLRKQHCALPLAAASVPLAHPPVAGSTQPRTATAPAAVARRAAPGPGRDRTFSPQQQQQPLQPDPAADDLDLLAAAAAAAAPPPAAAASQQHHHRPAQTITSIPDAEPRYALPAGRQPRYTAADKLQLSGAQMRDIGRRLRRPLRDAGLRVLRVFRYGVDDLRLYQAIDAAGLEGRVVVVDSSAEADAVLTAYRKRTRKNVNLDTARRVAEGARVPLLVLPALSAQRLVEAVGPLLRLPTVEEQEGAARQQHSSGGPGYEPRLLRWDELEGDGSEELLQLMWGSSPAAAANGVAGVAGGARWRAWCETQEEAASSPPALAGEVLAAIRDADVEDAREEAVPANPTARAGERHRLLKPSRPRSRIKRRQLRHDLAQRRADDW